MARKIVLKNTGLSASGYTPVGYESVGYQNGILSQKDFTENVIPVGATGATGGVGPIGATGATGGYGPVGPTGPAGGVNSSGSNGYYAIFTGTSSIGNGSIYDSGTATVIMGTVSINIFSYLDGNQANGYILTSDSNGNATWQMPASGAYIPLAGTTASSPLTGTIVFNNSISNITTVLFGDINTVTSDGMTIGLGDDKDIPNNSSNNSYLQFTPNSFNLNVNKALDKVSFVQGDFTSLILGYGDNGSSPAYTSQIAIGATSINISSGNNLFSGIKYNTASELHTNNNQDGYSILDRNLNDARYLMLGVGITGSGTAGYIPKYTSNNTLAPSLIYDDGSNIGINIINPTAKLHILGSTTSNTEYTLQIQNSLFSNLLVVRDDGYGAFGSDVNGNYNFTITGNGAALGALLITDQVATMKLSGTSSDAQMILNSSTGHQAFISLSNNEVPALYLSSVGGGYNYFENHQSFYYKNASNQSHTFFDPTTGYWAYQAPNSSIFTPNAIIHIQGSTTSNTSYSLIVQDSLANEIITVRDDSYTTINGSLYVATNPTAYPYNDYFYFNAGNLGINTLGYLYDPSEKLSVNGNISIAQGADLFFGNVNTVISGAAQGGDTNSLILSNSQGSIFYYINGNSNDAAHIFQSVKNGQGSILERFRISNNGTVVIAGLVGAGNRQLLVDPTGTLITGSSASNNKFSTSSYSLTASVTDTIIHGLESTFIQISVWDSVVGDLVSVSANNRTLNTVDITSSVTGTYDIIITG
jgi:hypothetical protein